MQEDAAWACIRDALNQRPAQQVWAAVAGVRLSDTRAVRRALVLLPTYTLECEASLQNVGARTEGVGLAPLWHLRARSGAWKAALARATARLSWVPCKVRRRWPCLSDGAGMCSLCGKALLAAGLQAARVQPGDTALDIDVLEWLGGEQSSCGSWATLLVAPPAGAPQSDAPAGSGARKRSAAVPLQHSDDSDASEDSDDSSYKELDI